MCAALLSLMSGCAQERSDSRRISVEAQNLSHAQELALQSKVSCVGPGQCHEAVAMLAVATDEETFGCNGFLIASDLMITNSHCVPKELQNKGSSCTGRMWALFPQIDMAPAEIVGCSSVQDIIVSRFGNDLDYALIKLDRPINRRLLAISRQGATDSPSTLHRVRTTKENGVLVGRLGRATCDVALNTIPTPFAASESSPVVSLGTCDLSPGDSGSPLLNDRGEVWGLVQSFFPREWHHISSLNNQRFPALNKRIGLATNLACVSTPFSDGKALPEACAVDYSKFQSIEKNWGHLKAAGDQTYSDEAASSAVTRAMKEHLVLAPLPVAEWRASGAFTNDGSMIALPHCVNRKTGLQSKYAFTIPSMTIESGINAYFQHSFRAKPTNQVYEATLEIEFPWATLKLKRESVTIIVTEALKFCTAQ